MYNQTFHIKPAAFKPAGTKAAWKASVTRKAIQKLRISLRCGKPPLPDFPGNLLVPSHLHLTIRINPTTEMRTRQRASPGGYTSMTAGLRLFHLFQYQYLQHTSRKHYFGLTCLENDARAWSPVCKAQLQATTTTTGTESLHFFQCFLKKAKTQQQREARVGL